MENKRFKMFFAIIFIIVILGSASFYIFTQLSSDNSSSFDEYIPEVEISDEQVRRTIVRLYFKEINSSNLKYENRSIDSKDLLDNPYLTLCNLLIAGPTKEGLESIIPQETVVNSAVLNGNTVVVDFSNAFISAVSNVDSASLLIYSVVNTLTELTEVDSVQFLIDGHDDAIFPNFAFSLKAPFVRK